MKWICKEKMLILFCFIFSICLSGCGSNVPTYVTNARADAKLGDYLKSIENYQNAFKYWDNKEDYAFKKSEIEKEFDDVKQSYDKDIIIKIQKALNSVSIEEADKLISSTTFFYPNSKEVTKIKADVANAKVQLKKRLEISLNNMTKKYDDIEEITWYQDKTSPKFANRNGVYLYFGDKKEAVPWLRFKIQYTADNWLFVENYIFKVDGSTYKYTPNEVKHDNGSGDIWEWSDENVNKEIYTIIQAIINSKSCKIRYEGDKYHKDRDISYTEKMAIKNVLNAFVAKGGSLKDFNN